MEKKEKNVIARVGNFVIVKESGNGMGWVSVKATSGFWTVRYREDNAMYGVLLMLVETEEYRNYLEAFVKSVYVLASCTPDLDFLGDFYNAYVSMQERRKKEASEDEDKAALEEVRALYEMKEEAEKENLDKPVGDGSNESHV